MTEPAWKKRAAEHAKKEARKRKLPDGEGKRKWTEQEYDEEEEQLLRETFMGDLDH